MANTVETFFTGRDQLSSVMGSVTTNWGKMIATFATGNLVAQAAMKAFEMLKHAVYDLPKEVALLNARVEEMSAVLGVVGKTAGYSQASINVLVEDIKNMGITTTQAQNATVKMIQANLDLSKSTDLARAAQDAGVIAQIDSSEALDRMIRGITTLQPEVLRNMGIIVSLDAEYRKYALSVGKTTEQLTSNQKQQVAMNAVLEASTKIAGSYEAAMGTAGKQLRSLPRYIEEAWESLGSVTEPIFKKLVEGAKIFFKELKKFLDENSVALSGLGKSFGDAASLGIQFLSTILNITKAVISWIIVNRELIQGLVILAGSVILAFKWNAIIAGVTALIALIKILPTALGLARLAMSAFVASLTLGNVVLLTVAAAYAILSWRMNENSKEMERVAQKWADLLEVTGKSSDIIESLEAHGDAYKDLLKYALEYKVAFLAGEGKTISPHTYEVEMKSIREEILLREALAAKAKQANEDKAESDKAAAALIKKTNEEISKSYGKYLESMKEAKVTTGYGKAIAGEEKWFVEQRAAIIAFHHQKKSDKATMDAELEKLETAHQLRLVDIRKEFKDSWIENAKGIEEWVEYQGDVTEQTTIAQTQASLQAYQEMYGILKEFGIDDFEFQKDLIEKRRVQWGLLTGDWFAAGKAANAEMARLAEEQVLRFGGMMDGVLVYLQRASREAYTLGRAGYDAMQAFGGGIEQVFLDLYNNELKDFKDYWKVFWQSLAGIAAKILRSEIENAILDAWNAAKSALGKDSGGSSWLGAAISGIGALLGSGGAGTTGVGGGDAVTTGTGWDYYSGGEGSSWWKGYAKGGILPGHLMPLRKFASGGIANSPMLGIIGEGGGPEAVVPLPDGRSIPVSMSGNASPQNVTINISAVDAASFRQLVQRNPGAILDVVGADMAIGGGLRTKILEAAR